MYVQGRIGIASYMYNVVYVDAYKYNVFEFHACSLIRQTCYHCILIHIHVCITILALHKLVWCTLKVLLNNGQPHFLPYCWAIFHYILKEVEEECFNILL